jgi:hypothetical protein
VRRDRNAQGPRAGYPEWAEYLERWGRGERPDDSGLSPLEQRDFAGDTWARLTNRLLEAMNQRLQAWQAALAKATDGVISDEFGYGRALQQGRDGVRPVLALATDPRLPEDLRARLTDLIENHLRQTQTRLEDHLRQQRDRGDSARFVEMRLRTLRDNALTAVITEAHTGAGPVAVPPAGTPTRRIIHR